jgi:hypothetical protein
MHAKPEACLVRSDECGLHKLLTGTGCPMGKDGRCAHVSQGRQTATSVMAGRQHAARQKHVQQSTVQVAKVTVGTQQVRNAQPIPVLDNSLGLGGSDNHHNGRDCLLNPASELHSAAHPLPLQHRRGNM